MRCCVSWAGESQMLCCERRVCCRKVFVIFYIVYNRAVDPEVSGGCIVKCNFFMFCIKKLSVRDVRGGCMMRWRGRCVL